MADAMVTGRIPEEKKRRATSILKREGMNASQAINLLFDRVIADGSAAFLSGATPDRTARCRAAAQFVDAIPRSRTTRFDDMTKAQIKMERLKDRGTA